MVVGGSELFVSLCVVVGVSELFWSFWVVVGGSQLFWSFWMVVWMFIVGSQCWGSFGVVLRYVEDSRWF